MLEVRNLTKIYSGKGGVTVKALDDVSVVFPETGMVFLLGKSGSGKSTLLNVAGGLDKPDGGEVIVKGKSSKDFSGSDFDSYRNTFIGFVFQEYNILNEFTIEQNIALALQLHSTPNDKKAVADLLEQVDLAGYAKRKPNTLSGGQKQRVAIARALIKEPEIIMADEPTGALDSTTGKQVLDTLKKLSEKKLVIVVSHDREFAEYYGDRIIELKDGKIISDVSKVYNTPSDLSGKALDLSEKSDGEEATTAEAANVAVISENTIAIRDGGELTDAEVRSIAEMLRKQKGEVIITADKNDLPGVKRACKINDNGNKESFKETGPVEAKAYDGKKTKFIKSHLPLGHAIKMGASGLKSKPFRLIFTILLAVAAFVLFGVASTFMLYDPNYSVSEAMRSSNYPAATIGKEYKMIIKSYRLDEAGNREFDYDYDNEITTRFGASEVASRSKDGLDYAGIYNFTDSSWDNHETAELTLRDGDNYVTPTIPTTAQDYYYSETMRTVGFSDCGADYMTRNGFTLLAGAYPASTDEVALPAHLAEPFLIQENGTLKEYSTLIGKKVKISFNALKNASFTISGVYNVGAIPAEYTALKGANGAASAERINEKEKNVRKETFVDYLRNSYNLIVFVTSDFYDLYKDNIQQNNGYSTYVQGESYKNFEIAEYEITWDPNEWAQSYYTDKTLSIYGNDNFSFFDKDGAAVTYNAATNGVYLSKERYDNLRQNQIDQAQSQRRNIIDNFYYKMTWEPRYIPGSESETVDSLRGDDKDMDYEEESAIKLAFVNKWFATYAYRRYLFRAAQQLVWSGDAAYQSGDFYDDYRVIEDYLNKNTEVAPSDAKWDALADTVNSDLSEAKKYSCLLETLYNDFNYYEIFDDTWSVINSLRDGSYSVEEIADSKDTIISFMTEKGIGLIDSAKPFSLADKVFEVNVKVVESMYYKDKNGEKGVLPILGYFKMSGSYSSSYFLSSSFMNAHATFENYQGERSIQVSESAYVVPADAKYNYLITPTDNSMTQIASLLSSEEGTKVNVMSAVYQELQNFLEMIEELEEIFLYVGLGVGVLAAFFLLNFISVSISAKKKDIGILRAVGARGSDVFKIFYAEAFIIAFICFVLACVGSYVVCFFLNQTMMEVVSMKLLNFGLVNIGLVFGISIVVSVIATFFPVFFAARKSPVEAIRAL